DVARGMVGAHQRDREAALVGGAAGVHRIELLQPLGGQPHAQVVVGDHGRTGLLGDVERVAHVVAVAMRQHDMGNALDGGRLVGHERRIAGEERVDQHGGLAEVEAEGGVAVPGDLHGVLQSAGMDDRPSISPWSSSAKVDDDTVTACFFSSCACSRRRTGVLVAGTCASIAAMPVLPLVDAAPLLPPRGALIGLDLGTKTIGVATSDPDRRLATAVETIARKAFTADATRVLALAAERKAAGLVLGLPVNMDGSEGPRAQSTRAFARNLARLTELPIALWDERLSTAAVERE